MTARPTELPRWASAPSDPGDVVVPPSGKQDDGWNPLERPPAQYLNWLALRTYQWLAYLAGGGNLAGHFDLRNGDHYDWTYDGTVNQVWTSHANFRNFDVAIDLPDGATVASISARVKPKGVDAPGSRMLITLIKVDQDGAVSTAGVPVSAEDAGSTAVQNLLLTFSTTQPVIDRATYSYFIRVIAGGHGSTGDELRSVKATLA